MRDVYAKDIVRLLSKITRVLGWLVIVGVLWLVQGLFFGLRGQTPDSVTAFTEWDEVPGDYEIRAQAGWQRALLEDINLPADSTERWFAYNDRVTVAPDQITGSGTFVTRVHYTLPVVRGDSLYVRSVVRAISADGSLTPWTDSGVIVIYPPLEARQPTVVRIGLIPEDDPVIQSWLR